MFSALHTIRYCAPAAELETDAVVDVCAILGGQNGEGAGGGEIGVNRIIGANLPTIGWAAKNKPRWIRTLGNPPS